MASEEERGFWRPRDGSSPGLRGSLAKPGAGARELTRAGSLGSSCRTRRLLCGTSSGVRSHGSVSPQQSSLTRIPEAAFPLVAQRPTAQTPRGLQMQHRPAGHCPAPSRASLHNALPDTPSSLQENLQDAQFLRHHHIPPYLKVKPRAEKPTGKKGELAQTEATS